VPFYRQISLSAAPPILLHVLPAAPTQKRIDEGLGPSRSSLRYGPQQTAGSLRTTPQSMTEDDLMQSYYVGLDVHSRESVFVVENDAGAIVARGSVRTTVNVACSPPAQQA
jgi:hypothetical protein